MNQKHLKYLIAGSMIYFGLRQFVLFYDWYCTIYLLFIAFCVLRVKD